MSDSGVSEQKTDRAGTDTERRSPNRRRIWLIPLGILLLLLVSMFLTPHVPFSFSGLPLVSSPASAPDPTKQSAEAPPPSPPEPYRTSSPPSDVSFSRKKGKKLYQEHCSACHGEKGSGKGPVASSLNPAPQAFSGTNFVERHTDSFLFWRTSEGKRNTSMPAFKHVLSKAERWQIVRYLHALSKED